MENSKYINLLLKVEEKAEFDFVGIYRRDGVTPYFTHLAQVLERAFEIGGESFYLNHKYTAILTIVALLHDHLEDIAKYKENPNLLIQELKELDNEKLFTETDWKTINDSLNSLNKNNYEDYYSYILANRAGKYTNVVKRADLSHNLETATGNQRQKYLLAREVLSLSIGVQQ